MLLLRKEDRIVDTNIDKKLRQHHTTCMVDGKLVDKEKKAYNTLDEAIKEARRMNCMEKVIHKVVAYKCDICFKYHAGRSHRELSQKDRLRYKNLSCY